MKRFHAIAALAALSLLFMLFGVGSLETGGSWAMFAVLIFLSITYASAALLWLKDEYDSEDRR